MKEIEECAMFGKFIPEDRLCQECKPELKAKCIKATKRKQR